MRLRGHIFTIITAAAAFILPVSYSGAAGPGPEYPEAISQASKSVVEFYYGNSRYSAIRISDNLILTAAHNLIGINGIREIKKYISIYVNIDGVDRILKPVEMGIYQPAYGRMQDWVLLEAVDGAAALELAQIAEFADKKELHSALKNRGDFDEPQKGAVVWSVSYPGRLLRMFPRPGFGGEGVFISRGHLKTNDAYKTYVLFTAFNNQQYDEEYGAAQPDFKVRLDREWGQLVRREDSAREAYDIYERYFDDGNNVVYHTADYAWPSGGGGIFLPETGHLLGIIPANAMVGSSKNSYGVTGSLYRIDAICRQSKVLSRLEKCKKLIR